MFARMTHNVCEPPLHAITTQRVLDVYDRPIAAALRHLLYLHAKRTCIVCFDQIQSESNRIMSTPSQTELDAAAFRRLLSHLNEERVDVQNIDLMILAGFCRNCLADWYRDAAAERGVELSKEVARERIYGEPFAQWKSKHQKEATPEQLAAFESAQQKHS